MIEVRPVTPGLLQVAGSVELTSVGELREKLNAAIDRALADEMPLLSLDLAGTQFADVSGLGVLLAAHRRARRGGTLLRLVRLTPELRHVLLVSRLYRVLDIEPEQPVRPAPSAAPAESVPEPRIEPAERRPIASS